MLEVVEVLGASLLSSDIDDEVFPEDNLNLEDQMKWNETGKEIDFDDSDSFLETGSNGQDLANPDDVEDEGMEYKFAKDGEN